MLFEPGVVEVSQGDPAGAPEVNEQSSVSTPATVSSTIKDQRGSGQCVELTLNGATNIVYGVERCGGQRPRKSVAGVCGWKLWRAM